MRYLIVSIIIILCIFVTYEVYIRIVQEKDIFQRGSYELEFDKVTLEGCKNIELENGYQFITSPWQMSKFLKESGCKKNKYINYFKDNVIVVVGGKITRVRVSAVGYLIYIESVVGYNDMVTFDRKDYALSRERIKILSMDLIK